MTIKEQVAVIEDEIDPSEISDEGRSLRMLPLKKNATRSFLRRSATFGYGVFFTLGTLGIVSLVMH